VTPTLVDVHSHVYPPSLVAYLTARDTPPFIRHVDGLPRFQLFTGDRGVPVTDEFTSLDAKLRFMDGVGIGHSVLSAGNPWLDLIQGPETVALAGRINAELASTVAAAPARVSAMGLLPNHTVASAIEAVNGLAGTSGIVGVITGTAICGLPLDSAELDPFWAVAAAARLPLLVHPQSGLAGEATRGFGQALTLALSFPFETTVAVARLVLAGAFERHPGLRVVAAHGGGTLPYLAGRLRRALEAEESADGAAPLDLARRAPGLFVDSITFSGPALRLCADVLGADRVLFGTDHPFPIEHAREAAEQLATAMHGAAYERIAFRNAVELFGLDQATTVPPGGDRSASLATGEERRGR
jgi:aminocarboxymuconate-semialdehyde decarboxylase